MIDTKRFDVALIVRGDDLDPADVTHLLAVTPTLAKRKGDPGRRATSPPARTGAWHLNPTWSQPADLDAQVRDLLARMPDDPDIWRTLNARYQVNLSVGVFMGHWNEGLRLEPETIAAMSARGLNLDVELYTPDVS